VGGEKQAIFEINVSLSRKHTFGDTSKVTINY